MDAKVRNITLSILPAIAMEGLLILFFRLALLFAKGIKGPGVENSFLPALTLCSLACILFCIPMMFYRKELFNMGFIFLVISGFMFVPYVSFFLANGLGELLIPIADPLVKIFKIFDPLIIQVLF